MSGAIPCYRATADRPAHLGRRPATMHLPTGKDPTPMAGRRRGTGRPLQEHLRAQRRFAQLQAELGRARTYGDRVVAAADYLRGALKHTDPVAAEAITAEVVRALTDAGTRAFAERTGATQ